MVSHNRKIQNSRHGGAAILVFDATGTNAIDAITMASRFRYRVVIETTTQRSRTPLNNYYIRHSIPSDARLRAILRETRSFVRGVKLGGSGGGRRLLGIGSTLDYVIQGE